MNNKTMVVTSKIDAQVSSDFINIELRLPNGEYCGKMELNSCVNEEILNNITKAIIASLNIKSNPKRVASWNKDLDKYEMLKECE